MSAVISRLTMRAVIERNTASGTDPYGHGDTPVWSADGSSTPCFVWSKVRKEVINDEIKDVEDIRAMFSKDANISRDDRLQSVTDRQSNVLYSGPLHIETDVQYKHNHVEVMLRRPN